MAEANRGEMFGLGRADALTGHGREFPEGLCMPSSVCSGKACLSQANHSRRTYLEGLDGARISGRQIRVGGRWNRERGGRPLARAAPIVTDEQLNGDLGQPEVVQVTEAGDVEFALEAHG